MATKKFVSTLASYVEQREHLKVKLRDLSNLKTQITYSDLSTIDNVKQSVSSSRMQAKVYEDIDAATEKFQSIQHELVMKTHDLAVQLSLLEKEKEEGASDAVIDVSCAKEICHNIQQQQLLELSLTEKLCSEQVDNDVLVTITQCFAQEVYMNTPQIAEMLAVRM